MTVNGRVTFCGTGAPLGNVKIYENSNPLLLLSETMVDGRFVQGNQCDNRLEYIFRKSGHSSDKESYSYTGSDIIVIMCNNREYS